MPTRSLTIVVRSVGATTSSRQLYQVSQSLNMIDRSAAQAGRQITSIGQAAKIAGETTRYLAYNAVAGVASLGAAAAVTGIKFNAMMERQKVAFEGFLGSAQAANDYVSSLYKIAAETPFEFEDVLKGTRTLVAYGMAADQARSTFTAMGDAIAATGGSADEIRRASIAMGQIQAAGILHAQDLNQLVQAGVVSLPKLTARMGTNTQKFRKDMKEGKVTADKFFAALTESWQNDPMYKGAATKQAKTFYGQLEKLRDFSKQTLGTVTEGLFNPLRKDVLPAASNYVQKLNDIWKRTDLSLGDKLKMTQDEFNKAADPIADKFAAWWRREEVRDKIAAGFEDMLVAMFKRMPRTFWRLMRDMATTFWAMGPVSKGLTVFLLLKKFGITSKLMKAAGALLNRRLFGGRLGRGGRGGGIGGLLGATVGVMNVAAEVVNVAGGVGGIPGKGPKPHIRAKSTPGQIGKPSLWRRVLKPGLKAAGAASVVAGVLDAAAWATTGRSMYDQEIAKTHRDAAGRIIRNPTSVYKGGSNALRHPVLGWGDYGWRGGTGPGGNLGLSGHLQGGGTVSRSGVYEVGERGSEQVFLPAGSTVVPHGGGAYVTSPIILQIDGKTAAQVMHRAVLKKAATR